MFFDMALGYGTANGTGIWYWDVVLGYMVLEYGTGTWYWDMVLGYGTGI